MLLRIVTKVCLYYISAKSFQLGAYLDIFSTIFLPSKYITWVNNLADIFAVCKNYITFEWINEVKLFWCFDWIWHLKVDQINFLSRNQLHCTENLNFCLMCKKVKHCRAYHFCSADSFSCSCFASCWIGAKIQKNCVMKCFYETDLRGIYLYYKSCFNLIWCKNLE